MYKLAKFIYQMGRKKAYAEIIAQLESSRSKVTQNRDGAIVGNEIKDIIVDLRKRQSEEEGA